MKSIPKTSISFNYYVARQYEIQQYNHINISKYNYINIKTIHPVSLTFFSNFLSFDSRVFIFSVFCISSKKLNSILCGIGLSFKSWHLELFGKIIIQLSSTDIFLGLCSRRPPCNFTE